MKKRIYKLNKNQLLAVKAYMFLNKCKVGLSNLPIIRFVYYKKDGTILNMEDIHIDELTKDYNSDRMG